MCIVPGYDYFNLIHLDDESNQARKGHFYEEKALPIVAP